MPYYYDRRIPVTVNPYTYITRIYFELCKRTLCSYYFVFVKCFRLKFASALNFHFNHFFWMASLTVVQISKWFLSVKSPIKRRSNFDRFSCFFFFLMIHTTFLLRPISYWRQHNIMRSILCFESHSTTKSYTRLDRPPRPRRVQQRTVFRSGV